MCFILFLILFYFLNVSQYVNELVAPTNSPEGGELDALYPSPMGRLGGACGEYRSRTDDLLRARQAL